MAVLRVCEYEYRSKDLGSFCAGHKAHALTMWQRIFPRHLQLDGPARLLVLVNEMVDSLECHPAHADLVHALELITNLDDTTLVCRPAGPNIFDYNLRASPLKKQADAG